MREENREVPPSYKKIAVSEDNTTEAIVWFHPSDRDFYIVVFDKITERETTLGPIRRTSITMVTHALNDVYSMRGKYSYIE